MTDREAEGGSLPQSIGEQLTALDWTMWGDCGPLFAALAMVQGQHLQAPHDSVNPHFRTRYASLTSCWSVARTPLAQAGLAVCHLPVGQGGQLGLVTLLTHSSGCGVAFRLELPTLGGKNPMQAMASHLTYARRAILCALLGITTGDDVDGNTPDQKPQAARSSQHHRQPAPAPAPPARPAESVGMAQPPHPSWEADRPSFSSQTEQLLGPGSLTPLAGWCVSKGRPRPRAMASEQRSRLLDHLRTLDSDATAALLEEGHAIARTHYRGQP